MFKAMIMNDPETYLIAATESSLINKYAPVWNCLIEGFGNRTPGAGRFAQAKSDWDVLHPGRDYADKCTGQATPLKEIEERYFSDLDHRATQPKD